MAFKSGDVIGFVSKDWRDWISDVINLGTFGIPTQSVHHVGILARPTHEPLLYECVGTDDERPPCVFLGKQFAGCQAHPLEEILDTVKDCEIWHYPLRCELYPHEEDRLISYLESKIGTPYDVAGAIRSGGWMFSAVNAMLRPENTAAFFCSEWVADAQVHIGRLLTRNVGRWNPNRLTRYMLREGVCQRPNRIKSVAAIASVAASTGYVENN